MLLTPLNVDSKMAQLTAVHQLTHATFYSPRPWIYEGLAHFAQAVYREREAGARQRSISWALHRVAVADAEKAVAETRRQNPVADGVMVTSSDAVLQKRLADQHQHRRVLSQQGNVRMVDASRHDR